MNTTNKIIRRNHNRSKGYDLENEEKYNNDSHNTYVTVVVFSVGTYAYFAVSFHDTRTENKGNTTSLKTCELAEATTISNIPDSIGSFTSTNIFPGHKEVASLSVTASGKVGSSSSFKLIYDVIENE